MIPRAKRSESAVYMLAGELMSSPAVVAFATETVSSVARLMLETGVGAVPVLNAARVPIGVVSDGDLLGRRKEDRRAWWLEVLANGALGDGFPPPNLDRPVSEVMSAPVISISAKAPVQDIAEALQAHRIKRLPVLDDGRLVGVVSRADLLCVVESMPAAIAREAEGGGLLGFLESLIGGASLRGGLERPPPSVPELRPAPRPLTASAFRDAVRAYKAQNQGQQQALSREAKLERRRQIKALLDHHVSGELWREMLDHAELAARSGVHELMLLRFPTDLCSDGGRMIDVAEPGWETTLRGEAAELYSRWRTELKPQGFGLSARIVSYDEAGTIGDIGLYLTWAD
jgi:CBS domain-containing protein